MEKKIVGRKKGKELVQAWKFSKEYSYDWLHNV
jgi:hypothetical protein